MADQGRDDDREAFEQAMADVRKLPRDRHAPALQGPAPVPLSEHDREVLRELDALVAGTGDFEPSDPDEQLEGKVPGLDPRTFARLKRGEFTMQEEIDLHGSDAQSARVLVERFLIDAHSRGLRCVRIVHGRGRNSPGGVPVLKASLPRWLARGPARTLVLAYASAAPRHGGAGATCVLLRKG